MNDDDSESTAITATQLSADTGGGSFELGELTLGIFDNDQPSHRIAVGSDVRQDKPLLADQGWILPSGAQGVCEFDDPLSFVSVSVSSALLAEVGFASVTDFDPHIGAHDPLLLQMVRTVAQFDDHAPRIYRESLQRALAAHLSQLLEPTTIAQARLIDDKRLRQAVDYIHDNIGSDLSLEVLAAQATLSPFHFARAFKKAMGLSPLQFVITERLKLSRVLLDTTKLTVVDIALRVGYEDVSRFRKQFKRYFDVTPTQMRER